MMKFLGGDVTIEEILALVVVGTLAGLAIALKQPELIKDFALIIGAFYFKSKLETK